MKLNKIMLLAGMCCLSLINFTACAQNDKKISVNTSITKTTVLLNNQNNIIPIKGLTNKKIASVDLNFNYISVFDSLASKYSELDFFTAKTYKDSINLNDLEDDLKFYNTILITVDEEQLNDRKNLNFIQNISKNKSLILSYFGNGQNLTKLDQINFPIVFSEQSSAESAAIIPQIIFGGIGAEGKLTKDYSTKYLKGSGFNTIKTRLKYTHPEELGIKSSKFDEIDAIAAEAIKEKAAPGLVVLVAKDGNVIFNKAYGTHTYNGSQKNLVSDIFDMASVTKTTATTPAVMRLVEESKLNLDTNIAAYIPKARTTPMKNISVREVMLHQAGFIPFIPFHNFVKPEDWKTEASTNFPTKVADNFFIKKGFFENFMWPTMLNSPIKTRGKYVYSDISMYVMQDIVEQISEKKINSYVDENFYKSLGMYRTGFSPRNKFGKDQIVPTEDDQLFRKTLLEGYVHDQGAALAGGVAGHAGLFSTANDIAIFYQMLLDKGTYGGEQYFKPETVKQFTAKQTNESRRGLGFDRKDPDPNEHYPSDLASMETFGHTGYTGTCVWVDPSRGLVYVFLSNRVNPSVSPKLSSLKIRGRIQDVINKAIDETIKK